MGVAPPCPRPGPSAPDPLFLKMLKVDVQVRQVLLFDGVWRAVDTARQTVLFQVLVSYYLLWVKVLQSRLSQSGSLAAEAASAQKKPRLVMMLVHSAAWAATYSA